jgi:hypothetical protein
LEVIQLDQCVGAVDFQHDVVVGDGALWFDFAGVRLARRK